MYKMIAYGPDVTIYRDVEWDSYEVRIKNDPDATYFTDDKVDAIVTALCMKKQLESKGQI